MKQLVLAVFIALFSVHLMAQKIKSKREMTTGTPAPGKEMRILKQQQN